MPKETDDGHRVDRSSGFDRQTGIYHSLQPPVLLPPADQPLSAAEYALSLLRCSSFSAAAGRDIGTMTFIVSAASGDSLTYGELFRRTRSLSMCLRERFPSLSENDVAFIISPASLHTPVLYLALMSVGVVFSPANPVGSESEINYQVQVSKPAIAFATSQTIQKLPKSSFPLGIVLIDSPEFLSLLNRHDSSHHNPVHVRVNQSDTAAILYSSGTTGRVKGVLITHRNLIATTAATHYQTDVGAGQYDRVSLSLLPLFHVMGFAMMIRAISRGEKVVLLEKFDFEAMLKAVEKYKVNSMPVSPPLIVAFIKSKITEKYDLRSLQLLGCGGAPLGKELAKKFREKFPGVDIFQGYGLTECAGPVANSLGLGESMKYGSTGRLVANVEAMVVDPVIEKALPPGQKGELWLRGPVVMKGYLGDKKATVETLDPQGWLKTGDFCYFDSEGFLYVVDRLKELIKYKAYQVPPAELEHILQSIPEIADAAVVPYPDEDTGEIPMAYIVRKPGSNITDLQIIDFVAKQVAPYKKIRRVAFINAIPKNPSGKILRRELMKLATSANSSKL